MEFGADFVPIGRAGAARTERGARTITERLSCSEIGAGEGAETRRSPSPWTMSPEGRRELDQGSANTWKEGVAKTAPVKRSRGGRRRECVVTPCSDRHLR